MEMVQSELLELKEVVVKRTETVSRLRDQVTNLNGKRGLRRPELAIKMVGCP